MDQLNNRAVLVTGGSNGIGLALAKVFARNGNNILLVARNEQILEIAAGDIQKQFGVSCRTISCDLSKPESPQLLFNKVQELDVTIDILVNNAGFGTWGNFYQIEVEKELEEMQLNMVTVAHLTKLFLRRMIERGGGKILNVSSTAGFQPGPMMAIYYASKAFVNSFCEALHHELKDSGITVTVLCPGPTATDFQKHAGMAKMHLFRGVFIMKPDIVAEVAYTGLMNGKRVVIPGILNKLTTIATKILPKSIVLRVVKTLHKRRG